MKNIKKFAVSLLCLFPQFVQAEVKEVPFTLDDRDRLIRTEQKVQALDVKIDMKIDGLRSEMNRKIDGLRSVMNARFEALDKRFDQLFSFLWAIIGIFTAMMVSVFGFAFWDRKLFLAPVKRENRKMLMVLRDYAKHQPKLQEILKNAGLL